MASICWASVGGTVMRATALDVCCTPVNNACGVVTTDGFVSAVLTQNLSDGTDVTVRNAADKICVYKKGCPTLLELQVVLTLCKVNPELISLMTGQALILDYAGNAVGTRQTSNIDCVRRFALEIWAEVPGTACVGSPARQQYAYYLIPCLRNANITGDITIDSANSATVEITATTVVPSNWNTGPQTADNAYKVVPIDAINTAGYLLVPIGADDHDNPQLTTIAPPVVPVNCGCTALTVTAGVPQIVATFPSTGLLAAGGRAIEIDGSYFTGATAVTFGGTAATNFLVVSNTRIEAVYPAKAAGTYPVVVTNPAGVSNSYSVTYV